MSFAEERGLGVSRMEDIILVTGRHLAKSWVRAVFSERQEGARVSFAVQASGDSVVHLEKRNVSGARLKFGPNGEVGLCTSFRLQHYGPDTSRTRIRYPRTNAYSFEGTASSAS
jgi:hypothetical protein